MKNVCIILLMACFVVSCASSTKLLQKGKYEQAIQKSSDKLRKKPDNEKELGVLQEAYFQANRIDREEIDFLTRENPEANSVRILNLYTRLDQRQDIIKRLPPRVRDQFTFVDYDDRIIETKEVAALVSYEQGVEFLNRGGRESARMAYFAFEETRSIYYDFRDVDALMEEALFQGTNNALFLVENNSEMVLPENFDTELRKVALKELNTQWLNFDTYQDSMRYYDYYIVLDIREIAVSPETIDRNTWSETKEIQDGMRYVLDQNGNVAKDSLGNDITEPNMITVRADITESIQSKSARVGGTIDFVDLRTDQLVKTEKISVQADFVHHSAVATGNSKALSEETAKKVGQRPVPFPPNELILMDTADLLKERAKSLIAANRRFLER